MHVISQIIDGGAIEVDGGASAPVVPTVATPLVKSSHISPHCLHGGWRGKTLIGALWFIYIFTVFVDD